MCPLRSVAASRLRPLLTPFSPAAYCNLVHIPVCCCLQSAMLQLLPSCMALQCVRRWVAAQREGSQERRGAAALACPLCRRPFESAVFDCEGGAYRWVDLKCMTRSQKMDGYAWPEAGGWVDMSQHIVVGL